MDKFEMTTSKADNKTKPYTSMSHIDEICCMRLYNVDTDWMTELNASSVNKQFCSKSSKW